MSNNSPITPPPELVEKWYDAIPGSSTDWRQQLAIKAAQWGADQELEACVNWVDREGWSGESRHLRAARRPKPPSLKEQAVEALGPEPLPVTAPMGDTILNKNIIERHRLLHRALEALPND